MLSSKWCKPSLQRARKHRKLTFDRSIMSYFGKFKHFSNVLIRIPPLFIIDSLLNGSLLKVVYQSVHPEYSLYPITTWTQLFQWLATSFTSAYNFILLYNVYTVVIQCQLVIYCLYIFLKDVFIYPLFLLKILQGKNRFGDK